VKSYTVTNLGKGEGMSINVSEPMTAAWRRVVSTLFKPFSLHTWLIVGFTAFPSGIICILFLWLSSRGKFMFLNYVVHKQAEIAEPWHEFRKEGDSLFVWRLVCGFLSFAAVARLRAGNSYLSECQ
jgi:hypothetical protein